MTPRQIHPRQRLLAIVAGNYTLLWWVVGVTGVLVAVIITVALIARRRRNA